LSGFSTKVATEKSDSPMGDVGGQMTKLEMGQDVTCYQVFTMRGCKSEVWGVTKELKLPRV